jgi:transcription initiation factor TFIID TATA-box-binding protein
LPSKRDFGPILFQNSNERPLTLYIKSLYKATKTGEVMVGSKGDAMVGDATVEPRDTIKIENVVASTGIGQEINLKQITLALEGADYDPEQFPGLVYRTKDPKTAALIFRSGKIVCTGAKSIDDVYKGLENVFQSLRNIGIDVKGTPEIKVQNIVASADLHSVLNLNAIAVGLGLENIEYEPEQFPGLVYRLSDPKVVVLLFGSGKLVVTGGRKPEDAANAVDRIVKELKSLSLL